MGISLESTTLASPPAFSAATVTVELLTDGRCAVSSVGSGFRSSATYKPPAAPVTGTRRCAMPPVSQGATVNLSVKLPTGAAKPGNSVPPLVWSHENGRWIGTAELVRWPEAIVVSSESPNWTAWGVAGGLALLMVAVLWRRMPRPPRAIPHVA
ncbi:MAG: hypothetical protein AB7N65_01815 [Vicinamibacterales bacterium]